MGLIKNAINFGNGFNIGAVAPIDSRMRVELLSDLTSVWTAEIPAYKGMIVTVMETSEVYVLKDAENYTSLDSWVKLGSASGAAAGAADALKQAKDYTNQEVKKLADNAVKTNTDKIAILNAGANTEGSVAYAVAAEKSRAEGKEGELKTAIDNEKASREAAINALDATVGGTAIAEGKHVAVQVVEENGKLKSLTVTESDIASATALTAEANTRKADDDAINAKIGTVGTGTTLVGMINAEAERAEGAEGRLATRVTANENAIKILKGNATTEGSVAYAVATEQRRAEGKEGELLTAINNEATSRDAADTALSNRLTVIEGEGEGSIKKAIADIKGTLGEADAKTLAALNDRIDGVITNAKTYSIAKATKSEVALLGTNVKEAYKLVDEDKVKVGEFIPVYKDSSLKSAVLNGQKLVFTYTLADETEQVVEIDVSTFLAESEFKNGLQVVDHVVSVKRNETSEDFLTVDADGIKLSGVQDAINAAKKVATDRLDVIEGEETVKGSIKKALKDAKDYASGYTDTKISSLNAEKSSTDGSHVKVKVTEANGVITAVNVTETDIAKASELTALKNAVGNGFTTGATVADKIAANKTEIDTLKGNATTEGSVAKAVSDAKASIISGASSDYNTLGKLENKVKDVAAAAKAAATTIAEKTTGHVTVSSSKDKTTSALTYTISETDIASAQELDALEAVVGTGFTSASTVANHIAVLEGVTVIGENAIVVDKSSATENKKVSLKLGTQPAEGVAGVVLSQDANGLVAKLYWGTF